MAHKEQRDFLKSVKKRLPCYFHGTRVLDVGSWDVNGTTRPLFKGAREYVGLDVAPGPNVDIVSKAHEYQPEEPFDVVVCCEMFEHDAYFVETLKHIVHTLLAPGGLFLFTCATTGRPVHGTTDSTPQDCPALQNYETWKSFYCNVTEQDVRDVIDVEREFSSYGFQVNTDTCDLYFWGTKRGLD